MIKTGLVHMDGEYLDQKEFACLVSEHRMHYIVNPVE
jgi:hypothetical protein